MTGSPVVHLNRAWQLGGMETGAADRGGRIPRRRGGGGGGEMTGSDWTSFEREKTLQDVMQWGGDGDSSSVHIRTSALSDAAPMSVASASVLRVELTTGKRLPMDRVPTNLYLDVHRPSKLACSEGLVSCKRPHN